MKQLKISEQQRIAIMRFWKDGTFKIYNFMIPNKDGVIKRWLKLGIIKLIEPGEYEINRPLFLKCLDDNNQKTLF